jgi:hypothetical protein
VTNMKVAYAPHYYVNIRSTPGASTKNNILGVLPIGHEVRVVNGQPQNGFLRVQTQLNGNSVTGFVSAKYLRQLTTSSREALILEAFREWQRFDRGKGKETVAPYYTYIGVYWRALGPQYQLIDGRNADQYWSAAFISYIVRKAAYDDFRFAAAHCHYIRAAGANGNPNPPFTLMALNRHKPQLGDFVCLWRDKKIDDITQLPQGFFASHCDVIVDIQGNTCIAIGGNVNDSVSVTRFKLDNNGFLKNEKRLFGIMKNNR